MLTIVDVIQLQCFPRFSLSLDSVTGARCYLDADGDRKLDMQVIEIVAVKIHECTQNYHYTLCIKLHLT